MEAQKRKWSFGKVVVFLVLGIIFAVAVWVYFNRELVGDFVRGMGYEMTSEVSEIKESLGLTGRGEFLFKASRPELSNKTEFNARCLRGDEEVAILGCYREKTIYVYDIKEEELKGIIETTMAHELLHAVFSRMSEGEKEELRANLEKVLAENREVLGEDLENYQESEKFEELYVRAGTEVRNLPEELEEHYREIFEERGRIVSFYEGYNGVFRGIKKEMAELEAEMGRISEEITRLTEEYEREFDELNGRIADFNNCATVAGCFNDDLEFSIQRGELIAAQDELNDKYDEINGLIEKYNEKIEKYNNDVLRGKDLNRIINSNSKIENF